MRGRNDYFSTYFKYHNSPCSVIFVKAHNKGDPRVLPSVIANEVQELAKIATRSQKNVLKYEKKKDYKDMYYI